MASIDIRQPHADDPRLLTVPQVARALGVSRSLVYVEMAAGNLRSLRVGRGARRIPADSLRAYVDARLEG